MQSQGGRTRAADKLTLQIRELRQARGITIAQLAANVLISAAHMSEVERGVKNLNNHLLLRIAGALGVQPADLIGDPADPLNGLRDTIRKLSPADRLRVEAFAAALLRSQND